MTTSEDPLDLAARLRSDAEENIRRGYPDVLLTSNRNTLVLVDALRTLVEERDEAQAKLAQVREWRDLARKVYSGQEVFALDDLDAILAQPDDEAGGE